MQHLHQPSKSQIVAAAALISGSGIKPISDSKKWSKYKDGVSNLKGFTKPADNGKGSKRKASFTEKPFES